MTHAILFTRESRNAKTGPIPVTTTGRDSCPDDCAFRGNGCYAEAGPLGALWRGMTEAGPNGEFKNGRSTVKTMDWSDLCREVSNLPAGQLWRHNQAGDLPKQGGKIDVTLLAALVYANKGKRGFTYTHHNVLQDLENRAAVAGANAQGFTVNLSGNTLSHADMLADLGIAPVVAVVPLDTKANTTTPKGRKVVVCPATIREDVSCADCQLCQRARDFIIGFPAHGPSKRKASAIASA